MRNFKKIILPIFLATVWIGISEFFRNQVLLNSFWTEHYKNLGLTFPSSNINGAIWGIWSLCFAIVIFIIARKFTFAQTVGLSWFTGFVLMWLTIGNLNVLPWGILIYAIPLSLLEAFIATWIIEKFKAPK
jgi:Na+-transporting NADH:ubiquinone oxidoreductase subunit NqrE